MRLRLSVSALIALAPAALVGQQPAPAQPGAPAPSALASVPTTGTIPLDRVVAVVGDVIITQSNLRERLVAKTQSGMPIPTDSDAVRVAALAALNELVDEELLLEKGKELKIEVPDADVNSTVDKQFKSVRSRFTTEAEFKTELAKAGYGTPDEYRRFIAEGIRRNELLTRTTRKLREEGKLVPANITDAEVQESFEKSRNDLPKREPSVTWRQIIIAPKPSAEAKERARVRAESLLAEIKRGADF